MSAPPFHRRLHVRIGAVVLAVLVLMALALLLASHLQQRRINLEVTQRLNLGLARHVLDHQARPLLTATGEPDRPLLKDMAMYVMRANPAVEVYVLDTLGRITGHALDGASVRMSPPGRHGPRRGPSGALGDYRSAQHEGSPVSAVDLGPVRQLLRDPAHIELPVLGDDPRAPGSRNIFSVAPIGDLTTPAGGYLYIVLRGQAAQGLAADTARSGMAHESALAVLLACGVAALALLASLSLLTRPLRRLTAQAQAFRGAGTALPPVAQDADEIARLESAMLALQARIAEQFKQVEDNDRMRRELVSNLSHDLRTPLTSIQGYAEHCLLKNETLGAEERARTLQLMLRHCTSLSRRIADLFDLSKLDAGRVQPRLEVFCLAELLQDVIDGYQLDAEARRVALTLSRASRTDACVRADIALMERVFQNLIDNALRHTPAGGAVRIEVIPGAAELRVSVADTGCGIAREHLGQVFERYHQTQDPQAVDGGPSAGLGLAIVKRILELHGSVIGVSSELARGTRFDFSLRRVV